MGAVIQLLQNAEALHSQGTLKDSEYERFRLNMNTTLKTAATIQDITSRNPSEWAGMIAGLSKDESLEGRAIYNSAVKRISYLNQLAVRDPLVLGQELGKYPPLTPLAPDMSNLPQVFEERTAARDILWKEHGINAGILTSPEQSLMDKVFSKEETPYAVLDTIKVVSGGNDEIEQALIGHAPENIRRELIALNTPEGRAEVQYIMAAREAASAGQQYKNVDKVFPARWDEFVGEALEPGAAARERKRTAQILKGQRVVYGHGDLEEGEDLPEDEMQKLIEGVLNRKIGRINGKKTLIDPQMSEGDFGRILGGIDDTTIAKLFPYGFANIENPARFLSRDAWWKEVKGPDGRPGWYSIRGPDGSFISNFTENGQIQQTLINIHDLAPLVTGKVEATSLGIPTETTF